MIGTLESEHLAALIPDTELRIRPREGHMGNLDAAEEVLDTLLGLWAREQPRSNGPPPKVQPPAATT